MNRENECLERIESGEWMLQMNASENECKRWILLILKTEMNKRWEMTLLGPVWVGIAPDLRLRCWAQFGVHCPFSAPMCDDGSQSMLRSLFYIISVAYAFFLSRFFLSIYGDGWLQAMVHKSNASSTFDRLPFVPLSPANWIVHTENPSSNVSLGIGSIGSGLPSTVGVSRWWSQWES